MYKKIQNSISAYERFFTEADDNEDKISVKVAPRQNRGTDYGDDTNAVKVAPRSNRGTDYGAEDDESDAPENEKIPVTTTEPETDTETDYTSDDNTDDTEADTTEEEPTGDDGVEDEPDEGDGPYTGDEDETDYSADDGADGDEEETEEDVESEEQTPQEENPKEATEKVKKFHLYKRYLRLYNAIDSFLEKIQNVVKNDATQNMVIKTVSNNLSDTHDTMFDYMTTKYKSQSYVQVMIFFETVISIVRLNFELLRNNKINLKQ